MDLEPVYWLGWTVGFITGFGISAILWRGDANRWHNRDRLQGMNKP